MSNGEAKRPLRRGWTTGTCASAAAAAAYQALLTGAFPDPVTVALPHGGSVTLPLSRAHLHNGEATAGIVKDAGDDPDVTHGAEVVATVAAGPPGGGIVFRAGEGVGTVTLPGLPLAPGEPAINPGPRAMIGRAIGEIAARCGGSGDVLVTISIPGGEGSGGEDAERQARHRGRPVDPRYHRNRRAVLLLRLDPLDPPRHRRGPRRRPRLISRPRPAAPRRRRSSGSTICRSRR